MMQNSNDGNSTAKCWLIAGIGAFLVFILLLLVGDWAFLKALLVAALLFLFGGGFLCWLMQSPSFDGDTTGSGHTPDVNDGSATPTPRPPAAKRTIERAAAQSAKLEEEKANTASAVEDAPVEDVAPVVDETPVEDTTPVVEETAVEEPVEEETPVVAETVAAPEPVTEEPAPRPAQKPVAADGKPEFMTEAREGGPDDLKQIKGVGPKLETLLHSMGIFHFDQIANWREKEVEWVDQNLKGFKGRVSRDEWVSQAKLLAKGEQTEFAKKVKKGGVY